jgi:hypothetical protein
MTTGEVYGLTAGIILAAMLGLCYCYFLYAGRNKSDRDSTGIVTEEASGHTRRLEEAVNNPIQKGSTAAADADADANAAAAQEEGTVNPLQERADPSRPSYMSNRDTIPHEDQDSRSTFAHRRDSIPQEGGKGKRGRASYVGHRDTIGEGEEISVGTSGKSRKDFFDGGAGGEERGSTGPVAATRAEDNFEEL